MTQQVDTLFINAHILTMDESLTQHLSGALAVKGGRGQWDLITSRPPSVYGNGSRFGRSAGR